MEHTPLPEWESGVQLFPDQHAVSFFMIISDQSPWLFTHRPYQSQLDYLTSMFGREPCWMKDAMEKDDFELYGIRF